MRKMKIIYWVSTAVFSAAFATTGTMYLLRSAVMVNKLSELGYPLYVLDILGVAKILGVIVLILPKFPRLKEWAYAGFAFDFFGAAWSHAAVQGPSKAFFLLLPVTLLTTSYVSFHKLHLTAN
jgi:uncharacterized membrane protein YphA (DoxX/SURF4 family)